MARERAVPWYSFAMSGQSAEIDQTMVAFAGDGLSGEFNPAFTPAGGVG